MSTFILLVCSFINTDCQTRATEYWEIAEKYDVSAVLLLSISLYECGLDDDIEVSAIRNKKVIAKDLCPMGLRIHHQLRKRMGGLSRRDIIDKATSKLVYFRLMFPKRYLDHYNSGWKLVHNNYGLQIIAINNQLNGLKVNRYLLKPRTIEILNKIGDRNVDAFATDAHSSI